MTTMNNRADIYQWPRQQLSLPAGRVLVFLDGSPCGWLEPVEVIRAGRSEFSRATLRVNRAAMTNSTAPSDDEIEEKLAGGALVELRWVYSSPAKGAGLLSTCIFCGSIEKIETTLGGRAIQTMVVARDFSAVLEKIRLYGRRVGRSNGDSVFVAGMDTVFNEDDRGNASAEPADHNGSTYRVFCGDDSSARVWSCAEVIHYLLCEYIEPGRVVVPSVEQLKAVAGDCLVRRLDVTGMTLAEALGACCEAAGLDMKFVPRPVESSGPRQALVFFRPGRGREVELNLQRPGEKLSISKTNVATLRSSRTIRPVTHRYIAQGDYKVFEATFELVKAWDPSLEDTDYDRFSPLTNPQFAEVRDVYRRWCLNEAGDYSGEPYNRGQTFDFSHIFGTDAYARRRRRFWPALSCNRQGQSLGYHLEVSYDGVHWWPYMYAFNNLLDQCGIWLSSERLDLDTWIAALKGVLRFRITASVVSDERLTCSLADGPIHSAVPVVEHVIRAEKFRYRKVTSHSIFAAAAGSAAGANEVDDSAELYRYLRQKAAAAGVQVLGRAKLRTAYLTFVYDVGDRVCHGHESRDVLNRRADETINLIERVRMDFTRQQTELNIVRQKQTLFEL